MLKIKLYIPHPGKAHTPHPGEGLLVKRPKVSESVSTCIVYDRMGPQIPKLSRG